MKARIYKYSWDWWIAAIPAFDESGYAILLKFSCDSFESAVQTLARHLDA